MLIPTNVFPESAVCSVTNVGSLELGVLAKESSNLKMNSFESISPEPPEIPRPIVAIVSTLLTPEPGATGLLEALNPCQCTVFGRLFEPAPAFLRDASAQDTTPRSVSSNVEKVYLV